MSGLVIAPTIGGFNGDGAIAKIGEVVRTGPHIQFASFPGEEEGVGDEVAADPGRHLVGPLVEVHVGMKAASLFHFHAGIERGSIFVERSICGREEAIGVVVGAFDGEGCDQLLDL